MGKQQVVWKDLEEEHGMVEGDWMEKRGLGAQGRRGGGKGGEQRFQWVTWGWRKSGNI